MSTGLRSKQNAENSSSTPLGSSGEFVGEWVSTDSYNTIMTAAKTDASGVLYMEFADTNGGTVYSSLSYNIAAGTNSVHRLSVTRPFYRTRFVNDSDAQTYLSLVTTIGHHTLLAAPANLTLSQNADAIAVRVMDEESEIAQGKRAGHSIINKFGQNTDVDAGSLPEDTWYGGGVYTGFPTGAAELVTVVSSSTDDTSGGSGARTVRISGLDASYLAQEEVITLNGTTLADSVNTWTRVNRLIVETSGSSNTAFNVGTLTVAHKTTTANIFVSAPPASNQSQVGCYTIPADCTGYLKRLEVMLKRSNSATITGGVWVREFGKSPRIVTLFSANQSGEHEQAIYGGFRLPAKTDVTIRVLTSTASNITVLAYFDMLLVKD